MRKRILDLPKNSRPRERLETEGKENLSDAELLALILGTGRPRKNVLELARSLFKHYPLSKLPHISLNQLTTISGIGKSKATRVLAAVELGKRLFAPLSLTQTIILKTEDVLKEVKEIADKKQEYIVVLYLDARDQLIQKETVSIGSLNSNLITPREIFAPAVKLPCAKVILAHNHPSQDHTPSKEDILFTKRVQAAGEILGISLMDHIIICQNSYFSFSKS